MGWATCGWNDEWQVWMGYAEDGISMENGCDVKINHGLGYVCGDMHEGDEYGCGRYMCEEHLSYGDISPDECKQLCAECVTLNEERVKDEYPVYWEEEYGE